MRENGITTKKERGKLMRRYRCDKCSLGSRKAIRLSKEPCLHWRNTAMAGKCSYRSKEQGK